MGKDYRVSTGVAAAECLLKHLFMLGDSMGGLIEVMNEFL